MGTSNGKAANGAAQPLPASPAAAVPPAAGGAAGGGAKPDPNRRGSAPQHLGVGSIAAAHAAGGMDRDMCRHFKVLVVGGPRVGKTCVVHRYLRNQFVGSAGAGFPPPTAKVEVGLKCIEANYFYTIQVWECPAVDWQFEKLRSLWLKDVTGVLVVVSTKDIKSFELIDTWKKATDEYTAEHKLPPIPIVVLANKIVSAQEKERERERLYGPPAIAHPGGGHHGAGHMSHRGRHPTRRSLFDIDVTELEAGGADDVNADSMKETAVQFQVAAGYFGNAYTGANIDTSFRFLLQKMVGRDRDSRMVSLPMHSLDGSGPPTTTARGISHINKSSLTTELDSARTQPGHDAAGGAGMIDEKYPAPAIGINAGGDEPALDANGAPIIDTSAAADGQHSPRGAAGHRKSRRTKSGNFVFGSVDAGSGDAAAAAGSLDRVDEESSVSHADGVSIDRRSPNLHRGGKRYTPDGGIAEDGTEARVGDGGGDASGGMVDADGNPISADSVEADAQLAAEAEAAAAAQAAAENDPNNISSAEAERVADATAAAADLKTDAELQADEKALLQKEAELNAQLAELERQEAAEAAAAGGGVTVVASSPEQSAPAAVAAIEPEPPAAAATVSADVHMSDAAAAAAVEPEPVTAATVAELTDSIAAAYAAAAAQPASAGATEAAPAGEADATQSAPAQESGQAAAAEPEPEPVTAASVAELTDSIAAAYAQAEAANPLPPADAQPVDEQPAAAAEPAPEAAAVEAPPAAAEEQPPQG